MESTCHSLHQSEITEYIRQVSHRVLDYINSSTASRSVKLQFNALTMSKKLVIGSVLLAILSYCWLRCDHFDPKSIDNQRILVTGASSGIGEEMAYQYSKLGARLVITARRESLLKEVVNKCRELGAKQIEAFPADMAKPEDRDKLMAFTRKTLGGLDQLILNHATANFKLWDGDIDENLNNLRWQMEVNFMSFVDLASKALPMLKEVKGRIGVVSSVAGKMGMTGSAPYATSKFALQGFFSSLRQELEFQQTGVSVTVCVLGFIGTEVAMEFLKANFKNTDSIPEAASVVDTASAIIKGVSNRVYEVYYPFSASFMVTFGFFFPGYLERHMASNLAEQ